MRHHRLLILGMFLAASTLVNAGDTLEEYAQKCDAAIGITVPDFNCDEWDACPNKASDTGECGLSQRHMRSAQPAQQRMRSG